MWMPGDYGALESVYTLDGELESESERVCARERPLTDLLCVWVCGCAWVRATSVLSLAVLTDA
jgi:hypothetical protein